MIEIVGFVLECVAAAALSAAVLSAVVHASYRLAHPTLMRRAASTRASVAFVLGTLPAICGGVILTAVAAPSLAGALGLAEDHCATHGHHLHVCFVHGAGSDSLLAALGMIAAVLWTVRALPLLATVMRTTRDLAALEATGRRRTGAFPLILVPGGPSLCHAAGVARRRVIISESLWTALGTRERQCALAHELAHLHRQDPRARLLLALAGLCALPSVARFFEREFLLASEEACDAVAAAHAGAAPVAAALVSVAALQRPASLPATMSVAFGEGDLEHRVRRLLENRPTRSRGVQALWVAGAVAVASLTIGLATAPAVHHAVETIRSGLIPLR